MVASNQKMFSAPGMKTFSVPIRHSENSQPLSSLIDPEETIIDNLAQELSNVEATRFVKRDRRVLGRL